MNDNLFDMFHAMEVEFRQHVNPGSNIRGINKENVIARIIDNEDVSFNWSIIAVNWDSASKDALLQLIVQHWVTVRGFSFSAAYMEKYKQKHKKTVQKSKGIRKTLLGTKKSDVE